MRQKAAESPISRAVARTRGAFVAVALFSGIVNLLALTGSFYMLQVYDRVLTGRSVPTLVALSLLALALYALQGVLEVVRAQVLARVGTAVERELLRPVHDLVLRLPLAGRSPAEVTQPVRDLEAIRNFLSSQAPTAFLDLPWMPIYLVVVFFLHWILGVASLFGMLVLVTLALATEHFMREPSLKSAIATAKRGQAAETSRRNFEVLRAMGFSSKAADRFYATSADLFEASQRSADVSGTLGGMSRVFRVVLQSAMLGLGAYLVLQNQMSGGGIIACSILSARALAPVEQAIANWRLFTSARQARHRLDDLLRALPKRPEPIDLPDASRDVAMDGVSVAPPGSQTPTLRRATFRLNAGDALVVIGPSGAGKSTLARTMVGAWPAGAGSVKFDGAPLDQWSESHINRMIGYLPQEVELFDGTVAENIARLDRDADEKKIIAAAEAAGVHQLILSLPHGYQTKMGEGGFNLSVGQRQRVGLARALYGDPFLIVLDEPNAHLDEEGDKALGRAIASVRARKGIVVAVSHRPSILGAVNLAAFVAEGEVKMFGPRDEVLEKLRVLPQQQAAQRAGQPQQAAQRPAQQQAAPAPNTAPAPAALSTGTSLTQTLAPRRTAPAGEAQKPATEAPKPTGNEEPSSS